jgi:RHS repeat-associated protein
MSWYQGYVEAGTTGWCSATYTGSGPSFSGFPGYSYGIETSDRFNINIAAIGDKNYNPPCSAQWNQTETVYQARSVYCPKGTTLVYQSSPLVGPYCGPNPPWNVGPNVPKQMGNMCPNGCGSGSTSVNSGAADAGSSRTGKADPVDVSNGNVFETQTDYQGTGLNPLRFTRYYNSLYGYLIYNNSFEGIRSVGEGWSATYFQYLVPVTVTDSTTTYNTVYAYRPDGRVLAFSEYNGVYSPDGDVADSLLQTSTGWQYQTADDTIETYDTNGRLLSITLRGGVAITVNYAAGSSFPDPPVSVSDAFGHTLQFSYALYSGALRLVSITDPANNTIQYAYDSNGNPTQVTYEDGNSRSYGYVNPARYQLGTLTDEVNATYASWTYSGAGLYPATAQNAGGVGSYQFSNSTNGTGGYVTVTDPLNKSRTYYQSLIWGVYRVTTSNGLCPSCGEDQSRTYDANGDITLRTDFNGNQTSYSYDLTTDLETSRTEAYGTSLARTITTQWDPNWRQPDSITEPNRTTTFTYDSLGNVLTKTITDTTVTPNVSRTWTFSYDSYGRRLTAQGPRTDVSSTTTYTYYTCTTGYQCGQLQTVTDPVGNVTTYNTYNAHGQPLTITDANGTVTTLTYDARLRLTSRQVGSETTTFSYYPTGLLKQITLPDSSFVQYTYDSAHRLTKITDGVGNYVSYTLDNMGNRTAENVYDPSNVLHRTHTRAFNNLNQPYQDINAANTSAVTTTYGYDTNGNQTSINAPLTRNTTNVYDQLNRLKQITDPGSGNTYFGYDANDNLASVKDPRNLTTSYTYNGFGDPATLVSPDTGTSTSAYDSGGNLSVATDARGSSANYSYDAANRVTQILYQNGGTTDQTLVFGYDAGTNGKGHLTSAGDGNHTLSWSYDALGRVIGKGQTVGTITQSVGYGYTNGELTALVTPSGQAITYTYNGNHQVSAITVNGTTLLNNVTYEPFGGVNGWGWGSGDTVARTYNTDGLISQIVSASVTNAYSFDNADRITGISDSSNSALTWTYSYDALDRLTSATTSAITDGWTYDASGNRLTQTGTTPSTFTVSGTSNQVTATSGSLARVYGYNAAGMTTGYTGTTFSYNNRGRMMGASTSGGTESYLYNVLGQLIEKGGSSTNLYVYDEAGHILGEYDGSGNLIEETVWLGDIPVATLQPNGSGGINIFYVHTDHLNTPKKITRSSDNALVWRIDQDPFGTATPNQNPGGLGSLTYNLRFPGQLYMPETGLNQNDFRDYDPAVGRYVESDPIGLRAGVNTYSYAGGGPIVHDDPMGLFSYTPEVLQRALKLAGFAEAAGGGPEDPIADAVALVLAFGTIVSATDTATSAIPPDVPQADSPERKLERQAYHRRCDESPPGGLSQCDLIRWKIQRAKDCIRMRQDYITRWRDTYPGHRDQIEKRQRELSNLEGQLKGCCGG